MNKIIKEMSILRRRVIMARHSDFSIIKYTSKSNTQISLKSGSLLGENGEALEIKGDFLDGNIRKMVLSGLLVTIGNSAFEIKSNLTSITIPNSVTSIGENAFNSCPNLTSVVCYSETPPSLGSNAFYHVSEAFVIRVPSELVNVYKAANGWSGYANRIYSIDADIIITGYKKTADGATQSLETKVNLTGSSDSFYLVGEGIENLTTECIASGKGNVSYDPETGKVSLTSVPANVDFAITVYADATKETSIATINARYTQATGEDE